MQTPSTTSEDCASSPSPPPLSPQFLVGRESFVVFGEQMTGAKRFNATGLCAVCGDVQARMHYGVLSCFGCKAFFRRALKRSEAYICRRTGRCTLDRYERNSCKFCRFQKCLEVGMDPKAVLPDRDAMAWRRPIDFRKPRIHKWEGKTVENVDWNKKLPVEMRTTLMQLMNIDAIVTSGDSNFDSLKMYPLKLHVKELFENPTLLEGRRTMMSYDTFQKVGETELAAVAHRELLAAIDWVERLCDIMDVYRTDDKLLILRHGFTALSLFSTCVATAKTTKNPNILCLSNAKYVFRNADTEYKEAHLASNVVTRALDQIVVPMRTLVLRDEESTLMKAVLLLNPFIKGLSTSAADCVAMFRDRVQETLFNVARELHPWKIAASRFGNLLLLLPSTMILGRDSCDNLQLAQTFGKPMNSDRLLCEVLEDPRRHSSSSSSSSSRSPLGSSSLLSFSGHESAGTRSLSSSSSSLNSLTACAEHLDLQDHMETDEFDNDATLTRSEFAGMRHAISVNQSIDE